MDLQSFCAAYFDRMYVRGYDGKREKYLARLWFLNDGKLRHIRVLAIQTKSCREIGHVITKPMQVIVDITFYWHRFMKHRLLSNGFALADDHGGGIVEGECDLFKLVCKQHGIDLEIQSEKLP